MTGGTNEISICTIRMLQAAEVIAASVAAIRARFAWSGAIVASGGWIDGPLHQLLQGLAVNGRAAQNGVTFRKPQHEPLDKPSLQ